MGLATAREVTILALVWPKPTALVLLFARPGVGAVTLALLCGLFALIYGVSQITMGVELRRTGKTWNSVREDVTA